MRIIGVPLIEMKFVFVIQSTDCDFFTVATASDGWTTCETKLIAKIAGITFDNNLVINLIIE